MRRKTGEHDKQTGFTIIELLIATLVFSLLLIVMLGAFIRTGDLFYKGVSMSKTQEDARNVVQSISDDIQFTRSAPNTNTGVFCIGLHRYLYQLGTQVDGSTANYGIERDNNGASCPPISITCGSGCVHMLDSGMQLNDISNFTPGNACTSGRCRVHIHVVFYGGTGSDLFTTSDIGYTSTNAYKSPNAQCKGSLSDTSLCATVDYDSTVLENI